MELKSDVPVKVRDRLPFSQLAYRGLLVTMFLAEIIAFVLFGAAALTAHGGRLGNAGLVVLTFGGIQGMTAWLIWENCNRRWPHAH